MVHGRGHASHGSPPLYVLLNHGVQFMDISGYHFSLKSFVARPESPGCCLCMLNAGPGIDAGWPNQSSRLGLHSTCCGKCSTTFRSQVVQHSLFGYYVPWRSSVKPKTGPKRLAHSARLDCEKFCNTKIQITRQNWVIRIYIDFTLNSVNSTETHINIFSCFVQKTRCLLSPKSSSQRPRYNSGKQMNAATWTGSLKNSTF